MSTVGHASLTGVSLHESKGVDTALAGQVFLTDGAGSGSWTQTLKALALAGVTGGVKTDGSINVKKLFVEGNETTQAVLLNTLTASNSATLSDTTSFSSAFNSYRIVCEGLVPSVNGVLPVFSPKINGTFQTTSTYNAFHQSSTNGGATNSNSFISIDSVGDSPSYGGFNSTITPYSVNSSTCVKVLRVDNAFVNYSGVISVDYGALSYLSSLLPMTGFQFKFASGDILTGTIKVYGWN